MAGPRVISSQILTIVSKFYFGDGRFSTTFNDVKYCRFLSVLRLKLITDNDYTKTYPHTGPFATGLITLSVFSSLVSELQSSRDSLVDSVDGPLTSTSTTC